MQFLCVSAKMVIFHKGESQPDQGDAASLILQAFLNWKEAWLTWSFFKQSFLKQILTEGEARCVGMLGEGKWIQVTKWTRSLGRLGGDGGQSGTSRCWQPRCSYGRFVEDQNCTVLLDMSLECVLLAGPGHTRGEMWGFVLTSVFSTSGERYVMTFLNVINFGDQGECGDAVQQ